MPAVCDEGAVPDTDPFAEARDAGDVNSKLHLLRKGPQAPTSPRISSTPAPERLTPTGITTNPSGGRKKIHSQGQGDLPRASLVDPITRGREASSGSFSKLTRPEPVPRREEQWDDSPAVTQDLADSLHFNCPIPRRGRQQQCMTGRVLGGREEEGGEGWKAGWRGTWGQLRRRGR